MIRARAHVKNFYRRRSRVAPLGKPTGKSRRPMTNGENPIRITNTGPPRDGDKPKNYAKTDLHPQSLDNCLQRTHFFADTEPLRRKCKFQSSSL